MARGFAELHLHLEGCLTEASARRLAPAPGRPHPFGAPGSYRRRRLAIQCLADFLGLYRDVVFLLRRPVDYAAPARDLVRRMAREGIGYAEVFVSPAILERTGVPYAEVVAVLEPVFAAAERRGRVVRVLLDSVRHWGPDAAARVFETHRKVPWARVVGFGLGGDEDVIGAREFRSVYARVRALGLGALVHAGETGDPGRVAEALEELRPARIQHGVAAAKDPGLLRRLARQGVVLDMALRSNEITGAAGLAVAPGSTRPGTPIDEPVSPISAISAISAVVAAGVRVTLSTDDPALFGATLPGEFRRARRLGLSGRALRRIAAEAWRARLG